MIWFVIFINSPINLFKHLPPPSLLWIFIISTCSIEAANPDCKISDVPIDVLFVLDVSGSLNDNDFNDTKNFTAKFVTEFGKVSFFPDKLEKAASQHNFAKRRIVIIFFPSLFGL